MKHQLISHKAYEIIETFPKAKNGQPFLTLKNGRKIFFGRFIKKYGLDGTIHDYSHTDLSRRLRLVEFFEYFMQFELKPARVKNRFLLDSHFNRMVIIENKVGLGNQYELISFYPK